MRTVTTNVYTLEELTEKAKERAYNYWLTDFDNSFYSADYEELIKQIEVILDISVDYSIDTYGYSYIVPKMNLEPETACISGVRLLKFIWNKFNYLFEGKYYSIAHGAGADYKYIHRRSKVLKSVDNCPITGCCADFAVTDIIKSLWDNYSPNKTYACFIVDILDNIKKMWIEDLQYHQSAEFFAEECQNSGYHFSEDGKERFNDWELDK